MRPMTALDIPKVDIHRHAETGAHLDRLFAARDGRPPYDWKDAVERLAELPPGMPRLALRTKDLPAMYEDLRAKGVEFLSEPQEINLAGGERVVCLKDPDGTIIELLEIL